MLGLRLVLMTLHRGFQLVLSKAVGIDVAKCHI